VEGAVSTDTTLSWDQVPGVYDYKVYWRRTDANNWEESTSVHLTKEMEEKMSALARKSVPAEKNLKLAIPTLEKVLHHIRVDDWVFGVASVSKDGFESPVASAVPGGAFKPYIAPEKK
jgi:hypothetical protein